MRKVGIETRRIILGMSGVSGATLGIQFLGALQSTGIETHLIMSEWAKKTVALETEHTAEKVKTLASVVYAPGDMVAYIPSGPLPTDGMVVCPCSMKTLAVIASGFLHNFITRCVDVSLKKGRKLFLVSCEILFSAIHLKSLLKLSRLGVRILPLCVGFCTKPRIVEEIVSHLMGKILDMLEIENHMYRRWGD